MRPVLLDHRLIFPDPHFAGDDGLCAVGGDLSPERLEFAYRHGIFPWFNPDEDPILWFSPKERMVLRPEEVHVSRSMLKVLRQGRFEIQFDRQFAAVMNGCATTPRKGQDGTWLGSDLQTGLLELHRRGVAHSVEAYQNGELVGGLYGLVVGNVFCGDSMFSHVRDASKAAFLTLTAALHQSGFELIDCQVYTDHLASLGAHEIPRDEFLEIMEKARKAPRDLWQKSPILSL